MEKIAENPIFQELMRYEISVPQAQQLLADFPDENYLRNKLKKLKTYLVTTKEKDNLPGFVVSAIRHDYQLDSGKGIQSQLKYESKAKARKEHELSAASDRQARESEKYKAEEDIKNYLANLSAKEKSKLESDFE